MPPPFTSSVACSAICGHPPGSSLSSPFSVSLQSASLRKPGRRKPLRLTPRSVIPPYNSSSTRSRRRRASSALARSGTSAPISSTRPSLRSPAKLQDGDVVEIDAGTYGCTEQSIVWNANNITVIGVGGRAVFNATGCTISRDKGIFNPRGTNMIIDNIGFIGVQGPEPQRRGYPARWRWLRLHHPLLLREQPERCPADARRARQHRHRPQRVQRQRELCQRVGMRAQHLYQQPNGREQLRAAVQLFARCANTGHEVKSRAQVNYILYNRLADEATGNASYGVDISNGGLTYIVGNVIQKGP
jgi:hypothetical protein